MAPKRTRKRKPPQTDPAASPTDEAPPQCSAPGCKLAALPGQKTCAVHGLLDIGEAAARKRAVQAKRQGDVFMAALFGFAPSLIALARPLVNQAAQDVGAGQVPFRRSLTPPPPPEAPDPFAVLGLEATASVEAVRERQRQYAQIFHPDRGGGPAAAAKLQEINAAAAEVMKRLKGAA